MVDMFPAVLSLCDYTGIWSQPYVDAGYHVIRVDLQDGIDIRLMCPPAMELRGIIAQPPCTHLAGSGARWWESKGEQALLDAIALVDCCCRFVAFKRPVWWVMENPIGRLSRFIGEPAFTFDPHEYAGWLDDPAPEAYTKRTCLWGNFTPPLKNSVEPVLGSKMHLVPPGPDRQNIRSATPKGFARAFFESNP